MAMPEQLAGLDVSLETTTICVIDNQGGVVFEGLVAEMIAERGVEVDQGTIWHWAQRHAPQLEH